jgi:hypothetical protein
MAMFRKPPGVLTPAELLTFSAEDWPGPDDGGWCPEYQRWKEARRKWAAEHPDSVLGNVVAQMRFERRVLGVIAGWSQ